MLKYVASQLVDAAREHAVAHRADRDTLLAGMEKVKHARVGHSFGEAELTDVKPGMTTQESGPDEGGDGTGCPVLVTGFVPSAVGLCVSSWEEGGCVDYCSCRCGGSGHAAVECGVNHACCVAVLLRGRSSTHVRDRGTAESAVDGGEGGLPAHERPQPVDQPRAAGRRVVEVARVAADAAAAHLGATGRVCEARVVPVWSNHRPRGGRCVVGGSMSLVCMG